MLTTDQLRRGLRRIPGARRLARAVRAFAAPHPTPPAPTPAGCTLVQLNGDPLWLPDDLLKFVIHTNVAAPGQPIQLLVETPHYTWVRDRLRVGENALDLGANIGLFAVMMARRVKYGQVGWVHALEASPRVRADLLRVVHANGLDNVCIVPKAISDRSGWAEFSEICADNVNREGSRLAVFDADGPTTADDGPTGGGGSAQWHTAEGSGAVMTARLTLTDRMRWAETKPKPAPAPAGVERVRVETVTIDEYVALSGLRPALIKIDVEGAEFLALEGGRAFISDTHPLLVIEIHPGADGQFDHARLRRFLDEYGYTYRHRDKTYYCE